jgi:hypothetical protein
LSVAYPHVAAAYAYFAWSSPAVVDAPTTGEAAVSSVDYPQVVVAA